MEKIFSDLKNSVNSAVKRSGELLEISKVKMAVADTKNEIGRKYRELGEKVYEAHQEDADTATEVEGIIWELDELFEVLKSHEMKLASLKKEKICENCKQSSDMEAAYCSKCGAKFPEQEPEEEKQPEPDVVNEEADEEPETVEKVEKADTEE